jgi:hypothetical protein
VGDIGLASQFLTCHPFMGGVDIQKKNFLTSFGWLKSDVTPIPGK